MLLFLLEDLVWYMEAILLCLEKVANMEWQDSTFGWSKAELLK